MQSSTHPEMVITRRKILRAVQDVLARKKVSGTRMRQVANSAGISLGTLNYYFPSKTSLLLAVLDEMQEFFEMRQEQLMAKDLDGAGKVWLFSAQQKQLLQESPQIEEIFLDFWGHAMVDPEIHQKTQSMYEGWRRDIRLAIQQGVETGEFDAGQAGAAPYLLVALMDGIALQYLSDKTEIDLEEIFQAVHQIMIRWLQGSSAVFHLEGPDDRPGRSHRKPYPTDLSEAQWIQIAPLFHPAKEGGRPRTTDLQEVVNALIYSLSCDCPWRMLPHDFPGWQTVYAYYRQWKADGTLEKIEAVLGMDLSREGKDL